MKDTEPGRAEDPPPSLAVEVFDGRAWPVVARGSILVSHKDTVKVIKASILQASTEGDKKSRKASHKHSLTIASSFGHIHAFLHDDEKVLQELHRRGATDKCLMLVKKPKTSGKQMKKSQSLANLSVSDSNLFRTLEIYNEDKKNHRFKLRKTFDGRRSSENPRDISVEYREGADSDESAGFKSQTDIDDLKSEVTSERSYYSEGHKTAPRSLTKQDKAKKIKNGIQKELSYSKKLTNSNKMYSSHSDIYSAKNRHIVDINIDKPDENNCALKNDQFYNKPVMRHRSEVKGDNKDKDKVSRAHSLCDLSSGFTFSIVGQKKSESIQHIPGTAADIVGRPGVTVNHSATLPKEGKGRSFSKGSEFRLQQIAEDSSMGSSFSEVENPHLGERGKSVENLTTTNLSKSVSMYDVNNPPPKPRRSLPAVPQEDVNEKRKRLSDMMKSRMSSHSNSSHSNGESASESNSRQSNQTPSKSPKSNVTPVSDREVSDLLQPQFASSTPCLASAYSKSHGIKENSGPNIGYDAINRNNMIVTSSALSNDSRMMTGNSLSSTADSGYLTNDGEADMYSSSSYTRSLQKSAQNLFSGKIYGSVSASAVTSATHRQESLNRDYRNTDHVQGENARMNGLTSPTEVQTKYKSQESHKSSPPAKNASGLNSVNNYHEKRPNSAHNGNSYLRGSNSQLRTPPFQPSCFPLKSSSPPDHVTSPQTVTGQRSYPHHNRTSAPMAKGPLITSTPEDRRRSDNAHGKQEVRSAMPVIKSPLSPIQPSSQSFGSKAQGSGVYHGATNNKINNQLAKCEMDNAKGDNQVNGFHGAINHNTNGQSMKSGLDNSKGGNCAFVNSTSFKNAVNQNNSHVYANDSVAQAWNNLASPRTMVARQPIIRTNGCHGGHGDTRGRVYSDASVDYSASSVYQDEIPPPSQFSDGPMSNTIGGQYSDHSEMANNGDVTPIPEAFMRNSEILTSNLATTIVGSSSCQNIYAVPSFSKHREVGFKPLPANAEFHSSDNYDQIHKQNSQSLSKNASEGPAPQGHQHRESRSSRFHTLPGNFKFINDNIQEAIVANDNNNNNKNMPDHPGEDHVDSSVEENSVIETPKGDNSQAPSLFQLLQCYTLHIVRLNTQDKQYLINNIHLSEKSVSLPPSQKNVRLDNNSVSPPQGRYAQLGGPGSAFTPVKTAIEVKASYSMVHVADLSLNLRLSCDIGELSVGDILVEINGESVTNKSLASVKLLLQTESDCCIFTVARATPSSKHSVQRNESDATELDKLHKANDLLKRELKRKERVIRELNAMLPWKPPGQGETTPERPLSLDTSLVQGLSEDEFIV